jgi:CRISPR-associated protein Cas2
VLKAALCSEIKPAEDSLRFYYLGNDSRRRIEHVGAKPTFDPEGPLII